MKALRRVIVSLYPSTIRKDLFLYRCMASTLFSVHLYLILGQHRTVKLAGQRQD